MVALKLQLSARFCSTDLPLNLLHFNFRLNNFRAHLELEKQLRKKVEELDKPPKYKNVVLREDPPEYMVRHL